MPSLKSELVEDLNFLGGIYVEMEQQFSNADYTEEFDRYLPFLREDEQEFFNEEKDPGGTPWAPLAPSTVARKGHDQILIETGRLQSSLVEDGHHDQLAETSHRGLKFGTEVEYAIFHQEGTTRMPARPPVGITQDLLDDLVDDLTDFSIEQLKAK